MPLKTKIAGSLLILVLAFFASGCKKENAVTGLPAINPANDRAVGASANDLLSAANYSAVKIELQYMPGYQPDAGGLTNLLNFLNTVMNKPGGLVVVQTAIASGGKSSYSLTDIATIEKNNRTVFSSGNQLGVYILYVDGAYTEPGVLGIAYRNTSVCIMGKTVHDNSGGIGQVNRTKLEATVLEHEFGHLLGLVDLGSSMQSNHKDAAHGSHCNNSNCLMYYAAETSDIFGILLTGNIPVLDAACRADLAGNGGK